MATHSNTAKTILGFCRSVLGRWIQSLAPDTRIEDIYNFLDIPGLYATSGQPSATQLPLIKDAGYELVINLAPTSMLENSVVEEADILDQLGLTYVHIPVDFKDPTEDDFQQFVSQLSDGRKTWVHCAANMRVSAFTYRYRTQVLDHDPHAAQQALAKIWTPMGVWAEFIRR
ncbi:MAG: protein tyrosine phosphatase family protein [Pseudomonadota bacterium]